MSRIFLNYRRQDSEGYVGRLYDRLIQHFQPDEIFMDITDIEPGADFVQVLEDAVAECDVFIATIGPQWLTTRDANGEPRINQWNDFVRIEIASALKLNKHVIPVLVGQAKMPNPDTLPDDLQALTRRNAMELSHNRFAYDVGNLIDVLRSVITPPAASNTKSTTSPDVLAKKTAAIKEVRARLMSASDSPLYRQRVESKAFPVVGEGNPDANIMFIGESPGWREAEQGKPFCGPSGEVLDDLLDSIQLARNDVFLTNILLDHTPNDRDPSKVELAFYEPFLNKLIDIIQPSVMVTLGRFAMTYILKKYDMNEKGSKISDLHGTLLRAAAPYGELFVLPMYHPAVALHRPSQRGILRTDFEKLNIFV